MRKTDAPLNRDWQWGIGEGYHVNAGMYRDKNREEVEFAFVTTDGEIDCFVDKDGIWEK